MALEFGIQFFPDVGPAEKSGQDYWSEALHLTGIADDLGFTNVRTVEHYFHPYGGYSPNPLLFLTAAAMVTTKARLISGAVLPAFNNPLKLAGEIGMLDAISGGRLEVGFARAFLPHEFRAFGVDLNESRARYAEGIEQVRLLLENEVASHAGRFHSFRDRTSLPRPTQRPRPPFWVAAFATPESFAWAGENGHSIMAIPMAGGEMAKLIGIYREAWRGAGHPGDGRVMLAFHMFCDTDGGRAAEIARPNLNGYLASLVDAAGHWLDGESSTDYPGYDKIIAGLAAESFESQVEKGAAWIGEPATIHAAIRDYYELVGGFEIASLQVNFNRLPVDEAERSMRLFAAEVLPLF
ncbi:MAG: LLM class flavin-dependent oxidoreductase [Alphaproteobacteria bacterium]|jgi:alkanesulfonate monooxygenase SsuD/methylene tetrahydromethanopterin reductase-like flavin-dependent oxidoreductase (luciferase family)|nr:LLM class flavin-dependent oxidoreductase [Alphaproteobacteria bacterium]